MILSLFIRDKEFHISANDFGKICKVEETKGMADKLPIFFKDFIGQINFDDVDVILYSSGPASFTTSRIMNSMLKGIKVARQDMKFVGISNFITYLSVVLATTEQGELAIPTMRGDFFVCNFNGGKLSEMRIDSKISDSTIHNNNLIFNNINLANQQYIIHNSDILLNNNDFITYNLEINYGITPEYACSPTNKK